MTKERSIERTKIKAIDSIRSIILLAIALLFGLYLSGESAEYVKSGMELAVKSVLPSSFTFMILSDFYTHYGRPEDIPFLKDLFVRAFGLPEISLRAFICGNVGGFPIGAKITADLYREGSIDKTSAQRLVALSSNPSIAFIMGGVGLGMFESFKIGAVLVSAVYLSSLICGVILKPKFIFSNISTNNTEQNYSFINSVKSAGVNSIGIISFITLFSVIVGLIKKHVKNASVLYLITAFLEVTNSVELFSSSSINSLLVKVSCCAFSLGFGGICVMTQASAFAANEHLSMKPYILIKLTQGVISALIAATLIFFSCM